ncbi:MerR family transcriptional regulator [Clostridium sp. DL1XJH146]
MRIKEVEEITGLPAKTIRFYESKGLISVKRSHNSYREYDEDTVKELKEIKLFRKLDISIADINEWKDGNIPLENLMQQRLEEIDKDEMIINEKKRTYKDIIKELEKKSTIDVDSFLEEVELYESDDYIDLMNELDDIFRPNLTVQIFQTLILSGPLLWLWINLSEKKYDFIGENIIASLICTVLLTLSWGYYFSKRKRNKNKEKKKGILKGLFTFVGVIVAIILTIGFFVLIAVIQEAIFVPKGYLLYMFKPPYSYLVFFFEIELIIIIMNFANVFDKNKDWQWASNITRFVKKGITILIAINLILFYICITGITVVTEDKIVDYSFYNPKGTNYSYEDIDKVETGFKGKASGVLKKNAGEFFYITTFSDGTEINFWQPNSEYEDTYLELEIFDEIIMKSSAEKNSSTENNQYCDLDHRYVDRFLRIVDNK